MMYLCLWGGELRETHILSFPFQQCQNLSTDEPVTTLWRSGTGLSQIYLAYFGWVSMNTTGKFSTWGFPVPSPHRDLTQKDQINPAKMNHFGYESMPVSCSFSLLVIFDTGNLWQTYLSSWHFFMMSQGCSSFITFWKRSNKIILLSPRLLAATNYSYTLLATGLIAYWHYPPTSLTNFNIISRSILV